MTGAVAARPGRIVIGTLGLDQHEVGALAISQALRRHGYEVIYLGRFNTPERLAAVGAEEDADIVGVSVHSWEFVAYVDDLLARCRDLGIGVALGGSVLTRKDQADLLARGVDAVFGPYASEVEMLGQLEAIVRRVRSAERGVGAAADGRSRSAPPGRLAGRVVIVTGAARGLGRAYAHELCRQGAAVVANDLDGEALEEMAGSVRGVAGSIHTVVRDITDPEAPQVLLEAALRRYGELHGLVSNAGLLRSGPILRLADEDLRLVLDVHVTATFRLLRVLGSHWRAEAKAGRGEAQASVVLTTSAAGLYGFRAEATYSAAKAAVAMLARVGADELGRYGITVNAVAPVARTRLTAWLKAGPASVADDPLAAEHVAPVVAWLVGPAARDVTGRVFEVGNGQVSVPSGWKPGQPFTLPSLLSAEGAETLLRRVVAAAEPLPELLTSDAKA